MPLALKRPAALLTALLLAAPATSAFVGVAPHAVQCKAASVLQRRSRGAFPSLLPNKAKSQTFSAKHDFFLRYDHQPSSTTSSCSSSKSSSLSALQQTALEAEVPRPSNDRMAQFRKFAQVFCNLFPVWPLLTALTALIRPSTFLGIPPSTFPTQIGLLMLCMGISLQPRDFARVVQRPGAVLLAFVGCYGVMPALAWTIGKVMGLSPSLAAGLVLVSCW